MKLSVSQLRRIIKEEVQNVTRRKRLYEVTIGDAVAAAGLNPAKFQAVMDGDPYDFEWNDDGLVVAGSVKLNQDDGYKFVDAVRDVVGSSYAASQRAKAGPAAASRAGAPEGGLNANSSLSISTRDGDIFELSPPEDFDAAVAHFRKAATWCRRKKGKLDFDSGADISFTSEDEDVDDFETISLSTNPKQAADQLDSAADWLENVPYTAYVVCDID